MDWTHASIEVFATSEKEYIQLSLIGNSYGEEFVLDLNDYNIAKTKCFCINSSLICHRIAILVPADIIALNFINCGECEVINLIANAETPKLAHLYVLGCFWTSTNLAILAKFGPLYNAYPVGKQEYEWTDEFLQDIDNCESIPLCYETPLNPRDALV